MRRDVRPWDRQAARRSLGGAGPVDRRSPRTTVQDTAPLPRTVTVPQQAGPADAPLPAPAPAPAAPLLGRDRPLTTDERQFALGLALLVLVLGTTIVVGLVVGHYVWT